MAGASSVSQVRTIPSAAPAQTPAGWQDAVNNVLKNGVYSEPQSLPATMGLEDIQGSAAGTHHADYMNLWGGRDNKGQFQTGMVSFVSEDWKLEKDGNFHIDQWLHQLNPEGTIDQGSHGYLVETTDGLVVDSGYYKADDAQANLNGLVDKWAKFQPKKALTPAMAAKSSRYVAQTLSAHGMGPAGLAMPSPKAGVSVR